MTENLTGSTELPPWAQEILASCPRAGTGVHPWLFKAALKLHKIISDDNEIIELLREATASCGRVVHDREFTDAVKNSADRPELHVLAPRWPKINREQIDAIAKKGPTLAGLEVSSPMKFTDEKRQTETIVDYLFPGNPWLCVARKQNVFSTSRREEHRGYLSRMQFIVPSTMKGKYGITQDGRRSMRTLDNTGSRRFIVVECDCRRYR